MPQGVTMTEKATQQGLASTEGLGANRAGSVLLCRAWGETDCPGVKLARTVDEVRAFLIAEWLGSEDAEDYDGSNTLQGVLAELAAHDWREDRTLSWQFEIGGVSIEDVYESA